MKNKQAFTLIELLVVVLIIGILAAIAVPQYQKAVERSRFIPYVQTLKSIQDAQEVYYLANGEYAIDLTQLDINATTICPEMNGRKNMCWCRGGYINNVLYDEYGARFINFTYCPSYSRNIISSNYTQCNRNADLSLSFYYMYSPSWSGKPFICEGYTSLGKNLCALL